MDNYRFIDAHVHTAYSLCDCEQRMQSYLDLLRSQKARGLGFADHMHPSMEDPSVYRFERLSGVFDGDGYTAEIRSAKAEGLCAFVGIEITYEAAFDQRCRDRAYANDYDYRIAAIHTLDGFWVSGNYLKMPLPEPLFLNIADRYYDAVLDSLRLEWADVIAHIGVYRRYLSDDHPLMAAARDFVERREAEIAKACAVSGKIVEVNTSGLFSACRSTMPNDAFLMRFREYGGEKICLSSDAHAPQNINAGFAHTAEHLKSLGFDKLCLPWAKGITVSL